MAEFNFNLLTHSPDVLDIVSTALGDSANNAFSDADLGKAMKMGPDSNHVLCENGDDIEGFLDSVRGDTVNDGYSFGGVRRGGRNLVKIGENQGETPAAVLDYVVADVQAAPGEKQTATYTGKPHGVATVRTGTPERHHWRIVNLLGDGSPGSLAVIERNG